MGDLRALVVEADGLVAERVRRMLESEGHVVCHVADPVLGEAIAAAIEFDLFAAGIAAGAGLPDWLGSREPLVILADLSAEGATTQLRVAFPDAMLVDRALADPDALRGALRREASPASSPSPTSPGVREAFASFELSERQLEVLARALLGEPSAEIARQLFISEATVRNHLHAIYERVGVSGRRELLGRFVRGLIEGSPPAGD